MTPGGNKPAFYYGYIVVAVSFIIVMLGYGTRYAFGIFFKPMLTEFEWTRAMTSGAFSISMMVYGLLGIVMGGLNDRAGPRIVLTLSGCLIGVGYFLMSLVDSVWQLYLFYGVIIGIGMSGYWVPTLSTVARWFTGRRGMMTGIILSGTGVGTLVISPVATRLIAAYDWRMSYIIMGGVVLVLFVSLAQLLRRDPSRIGQVSGDENSRGAKQAKFNVQGFSLREAVVTSQFWMVAGLFFCSGFLLSTVMVHLVPHATDLGISPADAANILAVIGGVGVVSRVIMGSAGDNMGIKKTFVICYVLMAAVYFWLPSITDMWMFYLFAVVFSLATSAGSLGSPLIAAIFGLKAHGLIFGVINLGYNVGSAAGTLLAGYIFDIKGSYNLAFFICAVFGIISTILIFLTRPTSRGTFGVKI